MRRGRVVFATDPFPAPERPVPTYPEYEGLRQLAEESVRRDHGFVDPVKMRMKDRIGHGCGWWVVSVLGHDRPPSLLEIHMLLLANGQDIVPSPPQWLVNARAENQRREAERTAARKRRDDADQAAWDAARKDCQVEVEVLRNGHARARYGYPHHLGHVVPKVDARSGASRRHRAGRALCETEGRAKPLDLSGGAGGPATCASCLTYIPKIRLAAL